MTSLPARFSATVLFGAAYYPEYQPQLDLERDLRLMAEAGFTVIRVGESVWSTWEPRDGEFDLDWLQPVLDAAQAHGISVILGTPTYAVPPWLQKKHPDIAGRARDRRTPSLGTVGRRSTTRIPSSVPTPNASSGPSSRRYADHPAVIGYQVDNEPGLELFHNRGSFDRFLDRLREKYGDVETLNREWGLTYWSHRLDSLEELWVPDGNCAAAVRPRLATAPGRADHRVHRLAGGHRARVRARRPVHHMLHRLHASRRRRRGGDAGARRDLGKPVLRHAGPSRRLTRHRRRSNPGQRPAYGG